MKKICSLMLIVAALGLVMVGCEDAASQVDKPTPENPQEPEEPNEPEEPENPEEPEEPEKPSGVDFEAKYSSGAYYGDEYSPGTDCYFISMSDNGFDENGYVRPNSTYYRLDLYAPKYEGEYREYMPLPEGVYRLDAEDSYAEWTFSADGSEYVVTGESDVVKKLKFEAGELVVTAESTTLTAVVEGVTHVVTFAGEHVIANVMQRPAEDKEWSVEHAYALYYGDKFNIGVADNFYLYLSDKGLDEYGFEIADGTYYAFDLYVGIVDPTAALQLPYGSYLWDDKDTLAAGTISAYYTKYYVINSDATGYADARYTDWASLTVDEKGVVAEVHFGEAVHKVVFEGEVKIFDLSEREPQPEYVMDEALAAAMRIPSSEIGLADNYFALAFIDDAENIELGVVMAGAATDKVLQAGTYDSSNDTLLASACEMYVYEPEGEYAFTSGVVVVTRDGDTYGFDIELTDEDGGIYHFTYEGVVLDMEPEEEPDIVAFEPVAVKAYTEASWDVGNFELQLYIDSHNYHSLDMMDKVAPNNNYLSAGVYRKSDDTITKWSNLVANVTTGEGANVADAEIELSHNVDGTSTLRGFILSEYGKRINIDWTGTIEGFNFDAE